MMTARYAHSFSAQRCSVAARRAGNARAGAGGGRRHRTGVLATVFDGHNDDSERRRNDDADRDDTGDPRSRSSRHDSARTGGDDNDQNRHPPRRARAARRRKPQRRRCAPSTRRGAHPAARRGPPTTRTRNRRAAPALPANRPKPKRAEAQQRRVCAGQASRRARAVGPDTAAAVDARLADLRCVGLLHRKLQHPALPAADLPGRRHRLRNPLAGARGDQRGGDRLRPRPQRLQRRRRGLDAVPARGVGAVRGGRQRRRLQGPVQPGRRDLYRRQVPEGGRGGHGHPRRGVLLQPLAGVRGVGDAARTAARRHPVRAARGDHRADGGPLPGARALALQRRLRDRDRRLEPPARRRRSSGRRSTPSRARR